MDTCKVVIRLLLCRNLYLHSPCCRDWIRNTHEFQKSFGHGLTGVPNCSGAAGWKHPSWWQWKSRIFFDLFCVCTSVLVITSGSCIHCGNGPLQSLVLICTASPCLQTTSIHDGLPLNRMAIAATADPTRSNYSPVAITATTTITIIIHCCCWWYCCIEISQPGACRLR